MDKPGFKVLHEANIDTLTCSSRRGSALRTVRRGPTRWGPRPDYGDEKGTSRGIPGLRSDARCRDPLGAATARPHHSLTTCAERPRLPATPFARTGGRPPQRRVQAADVHARELRPDRARGPSVAAGPDFAPSQPGSNESVLSRLQRPDCRRRQDQGRTPAHMLVRTRADADITRAGPRIAR